MGRLGMGEFGCVDTYAPGTVRRTGCAYQPSACCTKAQGSLPRGGTTVRTMYAYQPRACRTYLAYRTYRVVHPRRVRLTLTLTRRVRLFRRAPHVVLDRRHDLPLLHGHHGDLGLGLGLDSLVRVRVRVMIYLSFMDIMVI